jgi:hypothetical protein
LQDSLTIDIQNPEFQAQQQNDDIANEDNNALEQMDPTAAFCLVASWSMTVSTYSKIVHELLDQHGGYLCKVRSFSSTTKLGDEAVADGQVSSVGQTRG